MGKSKGPADRLGFSVQATRVHVKFGHLFRHIPPVIAAEILCMSKVAALFDMHAPCSGVKWGYIPYLIYDHTALEV